MMKTVKFNQGYLKDRIGVVAKEDNDFGILVYVYSLIHPDEYELTVWVNRESIDEIP